MTLEMIRAGCGYVANLRPGMLALRGITSRPIECAAERGTVYAVLERPRHEHAGGLAVTETCFISSHDPYNRQWRCASTGEAARRQARIVSLTKYFVRFCRACRAERPMCPASEDEEFDIGVDDRTSDPVTRTVRNMSAEEMVAAINLHVAA